MASQPNIINDISNCTRVPTKILSELSTMACLCIGSAIHDALIEKEEATVLNIGIGTLSVNLATMECKFIPSKELKQAIKASIAEKADPLEKAFEEAMIQKLLAIYEMEA